MYISNLSYQLLQFETINSPNIRPRVTSINDWFHFGILNPTLFIVSHFTHLGSINLLKEIIFGAVPIIDS